MNILLLVLGGACGAVSRHRLGAFILSHEKRGFPLGTLLINLFGALVLGVLCGLRLSGNLYLLLGDGFCGAFTTFSTFSVETVQLVRGHARRKAALFVFLSVLFGVGLFAVGYGMASALSAH